ncbi:MAG TPA: polyprenyl synthetase family protein [Thermomicrobiales bacterium]|nr:polyprenyl synthetase family protein [Thermomicrobiales bacterium]
MTGASSENHWAERCLANMRETVSLLAERAPLLAEMAEYHLGWTGDLTGQDRYRGKMIRPMIAILSARAVGGETAAEAAVPLAAAIELLHNFTLIHDDIQDNSPSRRHRPTVWAKWGEAQAINAGDALFAASHLALLHAAERGVSPQVVIDLIRGFDATTIEIVSGQVLDLQFEQRQDVSSAEYIGMITGKTARIVEFAAGGGAWIGGAGPDLSAHLAEFGLALGLGFQVQDDLLGTFGAASDTGKAAADDIRRKKQSLPVLLLRQSAGPDDRERLAAIYHRAEIDPGAVAEVLELMGRHDIEAQVRETVARYHDRAVSALTATGLGDHALGPLMDLTRRLESRTT